jgi:hypothetical protein
MSSSLERNANGANRPAATTMASADALQPAEAVAAGGNGAAADPAPTQTLAAGGGGKEGALSVLAADGQPLLQTVRGSVGLNGVLKHVFARIGGGAVGGILQLFDRSGKQTVHLDGTNGSLSLVSQLAVRGKDNADQFILGATSDRSGMFIGSPGRPALVQLTTGGNPGPTIEIDGARNAMLFLAKGTRTDSVLELNGNAGSATAGGSGVDGTVSARTAGNKVTVQLQAASGSVQVGGNGTNGTVSVRGADGMPLLELLGRDSESVMGLGQPNRPGRISMFSAKGEAIRLDGAAGDNRLATADSAEEFDPVSEDIEPGTVMVIADDGRLAPCRQAGDTRVAGVVSGAGAFKPALVLDRRETGAPRLPIALMGKVYCWADASAGAIGAGDLLTTGETRGHAIKAPDAARATGAIVGKALAPLASGRKLIPILVSAR